MRKRIAMISEHASPLAALGSVDSGGQNVYVAQISEKLAHLGYEVDVFTRRDDPSLPDIYEWKEGMRVVHIPAGPAAFVRKEELLSHMSTFTDYMIDFFEHQEEPYDLMHANFWMSGLVAAEIKAALGIPFVITFHALDQVRRQFQGEDDKFPAERFEIERRVAQEADAIIAECPQDKQDLIHFYEADPEKIVEIPCGFDPEELMPVDKADARKRLGIPQDGWVVLQLGRMVPRKGVDTAIRGFARMLEAQNVPARMLIVGGESREPDPAVTPEIGRLQKIAEEEGILDQVVFCGSRGRDELKYYYSAADVFISTPWYEPFGITPLEAMACGTPVIGARVGGVQFTVVDGETGFLVPANDPQAVAERMTQLQKDPHLLQIFSRNAVQRVNEFFTWQKVSEMISDLYEHILAERSVEEENILDNGMMLDVRERSDESEIIQQGFESAVETLLRSMEVMNESILEAGSLITECLAGGGKLMVCGNGGSAADAQHFSAELVGRFISDERKGLPVIALTADSAFLTAWSNDIGYDQIFSRQVEALGQAGDLLIGISTSGNSQNVIEAFKTARSMNISSLALLGKDGGEMLSLADVSILVPSENTQRIQEVQILALHLICELVEMNIENSRVETAIRIDGKLGDRSVTVPHLAPVHNHKNWLR
ncbi:MAG: glycosyltransferase [Anaerolineales bacterium]